MIVASALATITLALASPEGAPREQCAVAQEGVAQEGVAHKGVRWIVDDAPLPDQAPGFVIDALVAALTRRGCNVARASGASHADANALRVHAELRVDGAAGVLTVTRSAKGVPRGKHLARMALFAETSSAIERIVDEGWGPAPPTAGVLIGAARGLSNAGGLPDDAAALRGAQPRDPVAKVSVLRRKVTSAGGALPEGAILKVVNTHIGEVQYCYQKQLRVNAALAGRVVIAWTINDEGRLTSPVAVASETTLPSPEAVECILKKMSAWRFPKPTGGAVQVSFPFAFNQV